ncbi:MAG: inositol-3-phosphate synthase, partial [Chitinispirillaceae bacterium]|nr:inositol-3-phosphate synthase [Chitinispirillaceae bacterium]
MKKKIKIAIAGIGNCASSLIQGIYFYKNKSPKETIGLMHWEINGYTPSDIEIVAAFDIDARKVGKRLKEAVFAAPNCTAVFCKDIPSNGVVVQMGKILDGVSPHMLEYPDPKRTFIVSNAEEPTAEKVVKTLKESGAEMLLNYLPVGSEEATKFYAQCALDAGIAFINNIPVFIASNPVWAKKFEEKGLPIIGDDIKAQLGAT